MKKKLSIILTVLSLIMNLCGCAQSAKLDPSNPVALTMWHVYGSQTDSPMNESINEFNRTVGKEKGIVINVVSVTNSTAIDEALTAAAEDTPGVPSLPDLFTAYPRVAEIIGYDNLLDWKDYFTDRELEHFVTEFIEEGYFSDKLLMMPIAKSTELLFVNQTLFDKFAAETDIDDNALSTFEGLFEASQKYYDWSGGQDLYQINDFYHYFLTGMAAYDEEWVINGALNLESERFEKLWKPMAQAGIYGGLCTGDGYASDRWKTGEIICNTGSTAGILYLRNYVTYPDNTTEDIVTSTRAYPTFDGGRAVVVHRGGGLFALKNEDERKNEAAAVFAKWLTEKENSLNFVTKAGYLPVTNDAFDSLFENIDSVDNEKYRLLYRAVNDMSEAYTYCKVPVYKVASDTQASFEENVKSVLKAAHTEYWNRVANGEAPDTVLSELSSSTLAKLRSLYQ